MLKSLVSGLSQFVPLLFTVVLATSSYWLALQSELALFGQSNTLKEGVPDYYFTQFHSEEVRLGQGQSLVLKGQSAKHFPSNNVLEVEKPVAIRVIDQHIRSRISSESAIYDMSNEQLTFVGEVRVSRESPEQTTRMQTERLMADALTNTLSSNTESLIEQPGREYQANQFTYNDRSGELNADGQVKLKIEATGS
ncbi:MAG: LPS export ABC transporter periplasmic protein LptC [Limnobacter sp.]|nr:LPS export ABC transporter periplasmic protein LptC [Limnobacter sp.]